MKKQMVDFYKAVTSLKNQNGFSLVEIMVAAGMLGVVSLGVMKLTSNMSKSSKRLHQEAESKDLGFRVRTLFNNQTACANSFNGRTLTAAGVDIPSIRDRNNNVVYADGSIIGAGTPGALTIEDIELRGFSTAPANPRVYSTGSPLRNDFTDGSGTAKHQGPADLVITVRKTSNTAASDADMAKVTLGTIRKIIVVPVNVVTSTAFVIEGCFGNEDAYIAATCTALGGFIDGNGRCTEVHIFTGTGNTASTVTAANIGSAASADASLATHNTTALKILRNDTRTTTTSLILDDDEIQAVGAGAVAGNLKINEEGGTVVFGNGDNIGVTVNGTTTITGNTAIGDSAGVDTLNVNAVTTINGVTTINAATTVNNNATVTGNTVLGNDATPGSGDTLLVNATATLNGNTSIGNNNADTQTIRGVTTMQGPTVNIGDNTADAVTIRGTTILRGDAITIGDNTGDTVTVNGTTNLNGNAVNIGNANGDVITIRGNTNLIGNSISIGNASSDTIAVNGVMTLTPTPSTGASNNTVPNLGLVRTMMSNVLAPNGTEFTNVLTDMIANNTANDTALNVQSEWTCDKIRIYRSNGTFVTNGGTGCYFNTPDLNTQINNCSVNGQCSRVCIAGVCRTTWPGASITGTCYHRDYIYSYSSVNPSNSNAASGGITQYNCNSQYMVVGMARQYRRFACGSHGWRSMIRCCQIGN